MQYIVDRIEENFVVCEDDEKKMHDFEKERFPLNIKRGDIVILDGEHFTIDEEETKKRTQYIRSLMNDLWE
ncbi:hypothetical protein lbkm_3290 [Lachnospiraceae bacterium KM106-2]|nr:hypothetical protein lbkm_3290 [Lachnospiraceae bacterium KM106-2]